MALVLALSTLIGVSLGLLGGGGSILTVPILMYGVGKDVKESIATSLVVVGVTSLAGMVSHARAGNVDYRTGLVFGAAGMAGAYGGGLIADLFSDRALMVAFSLMMLATAGAMFRGRRAPTGEAGAPKVWKVVLDGLVVGAVTGLVGAGGGFLVVPALVLLGGLPMQRAVGTSLLVIAMKSFAGYLGHASHVTIDGQLAATMSAAAVVGSIVGGQLAPRIDPERLRKAFGLFVVFMAFFQLWKEFSSAS
jgi:uncharacterized membrane protein YfcA